MSRLPLVLVALVATLLLATGCGDSGPSATERYKADFAPLNQDIVRTGNGVASAVETAKTKNNAQIAVDFARLADAATTTAGSLTRLEPPGSVAKDHASLISGLRVEAGKINRIVDAAVAGDAAAAKTATKDVIAASSGIRDPRTSITTKLKIGG